MFIKKIFLYVFMSLFCSISAFSEDVAKGIFFHSSAEPVNNRTSLSIFDEKLQKFEDTFSISFDLSIYGIKQFGYILRVINDGNQEIDFVFVNFRGEDDLYLDFHSPITHSSVSIPLNKYDLYQGHWLPVKITFDLQSDKAEVLFNNTSYTCSSIGLKNPSKLKFVYGLHGLNLDVPQMAIRNIRITGNNIDISIPLNESDGRDIHDINGKKLGHTKNPKWLINCHHYWQKDFSFQANNIAGITYDPHSNRIFFFYNDTISTYLPQFKRKNEVKLNDFSFKSFKSEAIYNPNDNITYLYALGDTEDQSPTLAMINMEDYSVELKYPKLENELSHHNVFIGKQNNSPFIFGGYGKYIYSNKIYEYNRASDEWGEVIFTGDEIHPRFLAASGQGFSDSHILIMGGFGNESGKYEHLARNFHDLYSLDLEKKEIKKIWEIKDNLFSGLVPCSNLVLNSDKTHFYTLCYAHHQPVSTIQLYKFSVSDGSYEIVSDSIPLVSENSNTSVYLFFSELMQEFYAVIEEYTDDTNSFIYLYSLLSPPVSEPELMSYKKSSAFSFLFFIIALFLLVIAFVLWRYLRAKSGKRNLISAKDYFPEPALQKANAIYVFGDFTVYDKKGIDISYRFSSKLKSLFALILFNSKDQSGVSTEMMTTEFWPDRDSISAKNARGVTIKRLRDILLEMEGITLVHQNSKWFFTFEPEFYCDFITCEKLLIQINESEKNKDEYMHLLLHILKRGALFSSLQESWIDTFKREFENTTEKILREYIAELYKNRKYNQLIQFADLYFIIDPLDEEIMDLCLKSFQKIGKSDQALVLYNKFVSNYRDSMGEDPKQKFSI